MKDEIQQILGIVTKEQGLNAHRYSELKRSIDDIYSKLSTFSAIMVTKDQFNHAFESLSEDIASLSGDHHKLKRRMTLLEKKFEKLEDRLS